MTRVLAIGGLVLLAGGIATAKVLRTAVGVASASREVQPAVLLSGVGLVMLAAALVVHLVRGALHRRRAARAGGRVG